MAELLWDGYCPESRLQGKEVRMRLNTSDLFESEATGLQIRVIYGLRAVILKERGKGKFRSVPCYAHTEITYLEALCAEEDNLKAGKVFESQEELEAYLTQIKK